MEQVMVTLKAMVTDMVDSEWTEYSNWIHHVYPKVPKDETTMITHRNAVQAIELCSKVMCDLGENKIGEYGLGLIQEKIWEDEDMLISGSPIEEFAAVGVLRSWLREYEDCDVKLVKFRMDGTWECFEEDITIQ